MRKIFSKLASKSFIAQVIALAISIASAQPQYEQPPPQYEQPQPQYVYPPPQQGQYVYPPPQQGQYVYPPPQQGQYVYPPPQYIYVQPVQYQQQLGNFTAGDRWGTWVLNAIIPGLGSAAIMNDYAGMGVQIGVAALGFFLMTRNPILVNDDYAAGGWGLLSVNQTFNIIRSVTYEPASSSPYFFTFERWVAWVLNIIAPGSGSAVIMKDYIGMAIQMSLSVPGIIFITNSDVDTGHGRIQKEIGIACLAVSFLFNSIRSATYGESADASDKHSGLNLEFLPNRHGEIMPALTYRRAF